MQIQHSMGGTDVSAGNPLLTEKIRVVIAYNDVVAGTRAMGVLNKLAKRIGNEIDFVPIPWSFNLLDDVDWKAVAASDAVKADILILAVSSGGTMPSFVERWTKDVIEKKRGTTAAVVSLFDTGQMPHGTVSSHLKTIEEWVHRAGLSFYAPAVHSEMEKTVAHLDERAEKITPLLERILEDRHLEGGSRFHA